MLDRVRSKPGPVDRKGCGIPQNKNSRATVHPPSTSSNLHLLLFIHRDLPPASTGYYSSTGLFIQPPLGTFNHPSTGSCSSTPNRLGCGGLLGVLFI